LPDANLAQAVGTGNQIAAGRLIGDQVDDRILLASGQQRIGAPPVCGKLDDRYRRLAHAGRTVPQRGTNVKLLGMRPSSSPVSRRTALAKQADFAFGLSARRAARPRSGRIHFS
jgi:hypothetical protein